MVLFLGNEPQLKWKTFNRVFMDVAKRFNVSEVVFLGALLADVPHSISVPISGTSSNLDMKERLREMDIHNSRYEGPTGMIGVLQDTFRRAAIPAKRRLDTTRRGCRSTSRWREVPCASPI